jgi:uncharacterized protein (TIGR04255 family)
VTHYSTPAIKEAILSLEMAELPVDLLPRLEGIGEAVRSDYPAKSAGRLTHVELQAKADQETAVEAIDRAIGHQYSTADRRRMFRAGLTGFSFHQAAPYEDWEQFRNEARKLWDVYYGVVRAFPTQMGVRFINRLPIPLGEDLGNYLLTDLKIGEALPQTFVEMYARVVVPYRDHVVLYPTSVFPARNS